MRHRVLIELPATCQEIRRKLAAWVELYGAEPTMEITGTFRCKDGELTFPNGNAVIDVGRQYLTSLIDGKPEKVDPAHPFGASSRPYLIFEDGRGR